MLVWLDWATLACVVWLAEVALCGVGPGSLNLAAPNTGDSRLVPPSTLDFVL